jgi:hypothetical protein
VGPSLFLLSPAQSQGPRAQLLLQPRASFDLARRLRGPDGAELGEVFSFLSGLYFRGKLAYARAFGRPPRGFPPALVITPAEGLRPAEMRIDLERLRAFGAVPIDAGEPRYVEPLLRDALQLEAGVPRSCRIVLLGSIASGKYVEPLIGVFGERLLFPESFVGRGDMSRGGLLLRCVEARHELEYVPVLGAARHGARPPRLTPKRRS